MAAGAHLYFFALALLVSILLVDFTLFGLFTFFLALLLVIRDDEAITVLLVVVILVFFGIGNVEIGSQ